MAAQQEEVEYRDVLGWPGYRVGSDGSVWSCRKMGPARRTRPATPARWRRLAGYLTSYGYLVVGLSAGGRHSLFLVHRLVLETFVGPCPDGLQTRHLNGNPTDNRASNLTWGTSQENADDKRRHGSLLCREAAPAAKLTSAAIVQMRERYVAGETQAALASAFGVNQSTVSHAVRGKTWGGERAVPAGAPRPSRKGHRGSRSGAKLSWPLVREIRRLCASGQATRQELADRLRVTLWTINAVVRGQTWKAEDDPGTE